MSIDKSPVYSIIYINKCADGKKYHTIPTVQRAAVWCEAVSAPWREIVPEQPVEGAQRPCKQRRLQPLQCRTLLEVRERVCSESCRLVQGSQRFVRKIIPEQPAQRVQNPCKQRRLQPLPCRALLEARERVCTARQREWYRRELDVTRSLSLEESRGQGLFLFRKISLREWIRSGTGIGIGATPCS